MSMCVVRRPWYLTGQPQLTDLSVLSMAVACLCLVTHLCTSADAVWAWLGLETAQSRRTGGLALIGPCKLPLKSEARLQIPTSTCTACRWLLQRPSTARTQRTLALAAAPMMGTRLPRSRALYCWGMHSVPCSGWSTCCAWPRWKCCTNGPIKSSRCGLGLERWLAGISLLLSAQACCWAKQLCCIWA